MSRPLEPHSGTSLVSRVFADETEGRCSCDGIGWALLQWPVSFEEEETHKRTGAGGRGPLRWRQRLERHIRRHGDIEDGQWQRELGEAWRNPP